jgi:hypothetical protein
MGGSSRANGGELSPEQHRLIQELGRKPRSAKLREAIQSLLAHRWWTTRELAAALGRDVESLVEDHLGPMAREGLLERLHPDPTHPAQAYKATDGPPFASKKDIEDA